MEKYKFKSTVFLVFLLVSLFINGLLLYMLISGYSSNKNYCTDTKMPVDVDALTKEVNQIYKDAYELINGGASNFYIPSDYADNNNPDSACYLVNFNGLDKYFTSELLAKLSTNLIQVNGNYYDCNEEIAKRLFVSLFGITDQGIRDLKYVTSSDDIILVNGKLSYNSFIPGDASPLYMVFKRVEDKLLIDYFE